ncbi:MAG: class I SAM-dependent methyltransferase [Tepidisphaeraceae bacterium]|jgi:SAM-dependent methyltransferase
MCGGQLCGVVGPIYFNKPTYFGSAPIDLSELTIRLLKCPDCEFQFTHPRIPPERLLVLYSQIEAHHWGIEVDSYERQYDIIGAMLARYAIGRRILDVGCFTGSLLKYLGPEWDRNGVEPSVAAAQITRRTGATVLGATLEDIPPRTPPFDVITAIDVIEHISEPFAFFERSRDLLKPGGVVLIVTGDTQSLTWKLMKNRYWYCSLPGHVSFFSGPTMKYLENRLNFQRLERCRRRHIRSRLLRHVKMLLQNVFYELGVAAGGLGIPKLRKLTVDAPGPNWITAPDHMFYAARRL